MNPAYEVGRNIGNNIGNTYAKYKDNNAIDQILSEAMSSGDPEVLQNSIGKILSQVSPERQGVAVQFLQNRFQNIEKKKEQERHNKAALEVGINPNLSPDLQKIQFDNNSNSKLAQSIINPQGNQSNSVPQIQPNNGMAQNEPSLGRNANAATNPNIAPPITNPQQNSGGTKFEDLSNEQLIALSSVKGFSEAAKQQLRINQENKKINQKEKQASREEELQFHKESEKYDEELLKSSKNAKNQIETISNIEKALNSKNVSPASLANIFKGMGKIGDKISEALINKDEATLMASIPQLLEGWKEVFGVRLSDADLKLLQDKLPSIGKSPEANKAIVKVLKKYADMTLLRNSVAREIKEKNKGLRPLGYADLVEKTFEERMAPVKIINPNNGKIIEIPAYKVSEAILGGGKLAPEGAINE